MMHHIACDGGRWIWVLPAWSCSSSSSTTRSSTTSGSASSPGTPSPPAPTFVGFDNYRTAADDPIFWRALRNNTLFAVVSLVFQVGFALVLAAVLEEFVRQRLRGILRTIYFIPAAISITVAGILFSFIYNPQIGLLNRLLERRRARIAGSTPGWASRGRRSGSIIAMSQWQSIGYTAVLFVVAIQRIPRELYEAAKVDGAGPVRTLLLRDGPHGAGDDHPDDRSSPSPAPSSSSTRSW